MKIPINISSSAGGLNRKVNFCKQHTTGKEELIECVFNIKSNETKDLDEYVETFHILENLDVDLDYDFENSVENSVDISPFTKAVSYPLYTPAQIKKAYNVPVIQKLPNVRKVVIAIVSAFHNPYLNTDMAAFSSRFNLPRCDLSVYNLGGNSFVPGWAVETTLDVQWSFAINPNAKIILVEARSNNFNDMANAVKYANRFNPDVVSMSWGQADSGNSPSWTNICNNNKTCYLASSGNSNRQGFPSVTPNIMSIGGTSLYLNNLNERLYEKPWSLSGSGFSASFSKPSYQPILSSNKRNRRMVPDVCSVGDPNTGVVIVANKKPYRAGGTSLSAPLTAGIISLAIQNRLNNNKSTLTTIPGLSNSIQPLLYNPLIYDICFNDITSGASGGNVAKYGFDLATGLGTINSGNLINYLIN